MEESSKSWGTSRYNCHIIYVVIISGCSGCGGERSNNRLGVETILG